MSKHLRTNPSDDVYFREAVVTGTAHILELYLINTGNADLTITDIALTSGLRFTWFFPSNSPTQTLPITLAPKVNFLILLTFDPLSGEENTLNTDTLTITHDGDNSPYTLDVSGYNRPGGTPRYQISPSSWSFDWVDGRDLTAGTPFGQMTNDVHLTVGNTGDVPLTIRGISVNSPGIAMAPVPQFPIVLAPGGGLTFTFSCVSSFVGFAEYDSAIIFLTDSPSSPDYYVFSITGLAVVSAYSLTGTGLRPFFGFTATIKQVELLSFDTEETTTFKRVHNFGISGVEKSLTGVRFKYEDWGVATVNVLAKVSTTNDVTGAQLTKTVNANVTIGTAGADQYVKSAFVKLEVEGELIEIVISRTSGNGRLVITEYMPVYDDWTELTVLGNLPAVVSAYNVTGTPLTLAAFGATMRQFNPTNLDTEEACSIVLQRNLQEPGVEKTVSKVLLKYEDLGTAATVTITDKTKRQTVTSVVVLTTSSSDGFIRPAEFDMVNSDELHQITVSRAAAGGPVSIVELIPTTAPRGVTVKE